MDSLHPIFLNGFAPLIQLWAGICLLFFYEKFLDLSPFAKSIADIQKNLKQFFMSYINFIPNKYLGLKKEFRCLDPWPFLRSTIKNLAYVSFAYAVILLCYIGIEQHPVYATYGCTFQVLDVLFILYVICATLGYKLRFFHSVKTAVVFIAILVTYFHFHIPVNNFLLSHGLCIGDYYSKSNLTVITIFVAVSPVFCIGLLLLILDYIWKRKMNNIATLRQNIDLMFDVLGGFKEIKELPEDYIDAIEKEVGHQVIFGVDASQAINNTIAKLISEECERLFKNSKLDIRNNNSEESEEESEEE